MSPKTPHAGVSTSREQVGTAAAAARRVLAVRPSGLFTDIDGTLSPIVAVPEAAAVPKPIKLALATLAERLDLVAAVTGRSVEEARGMVGLESVAYVGNHGFERSSGGRVVVHPDAEPYVPLIAETLRTIAEEVQAPGIIFENKGVTASVHFRQTGDPETVRATLLDAIARGPHAGELRIVEGRFVLNLLPRLRLDKGYAVEELAAERGLRGAIFIGDDVTDLHAFKALTRLHQSHGLATLSIAVLSPEAPSELVGATDLALQSVAEVGALLAALAVDPFSGDD